MKLKIYFTRIRWQIRLGHRSPFPSQALFVLPGCLGNHRARDSGGDSVPYKESGETCPPCVQNELHLSWSLLTSPASPRTFLPHVNKTLAVLAFSHFQAPSTSEPSHTLPTIWSNLLPTLPLDYANSFFKSQRKCHFLRAAFFELHHLNNTPR